MANWKMAKAFGRAIVDPAATNGGRDMVLKSKTVQTRPAGTELATPTEAQRAFDRGALDAGVALGDAIENNEIPDEARRIWQNYDFDFERSYGPRAAYERAVKLARTSEDEYLPASAEEFEERYGFAVDGHLPDCGNAIQRQFDNAITNQTDEALEKDFDEGFKAALAKRRGKIRDAMGDARDADESANAGIDDIRKTAIEMLKSGQDIGDVLRILKGE